MANRSQNKTVPVLLSIGELARRVGVRPSLLRYYEEQKLLLPTTRTEAGYRRYHPDAEHTLRLVQRAQRLGFTLADIRVLLDGWRSGNLDDTTLLETTEARALELERQITQLLVLQHELNLFLQTLYQHTQPPHAHNGTHLFQQVLNRVCANPLGKTPETTLDWLLSYTGCVLSSNEGRAILAQLRGQHVHLWQEGDTYHMLIVGHDPTVEAALHALVQIESACATYATPAEAPVLSTTDEGYLITASGPLAFLLARLFLALEQDSAPA
jgi:MerR family Zn(II)-responsive transcriptional regulator of zntA